MRLHTALFPGKILSVEKSGDFKKALAFAEMPWEKQVDLLYGTSLYVTEGENLNADYFLRQELIKARHTPVNKAVNFAHSISGQSFHGQTIGICGNMYDSMLMLEKGSTQIQVPEDKIYTEQHDGEMVYRIDYPNADTYRLHLLTAWVVYAFDFPELAEEIVKAVKGETQNEISVSMEVLFSDYKFRAGAITPLESFQKRLPGDIYKGEANESLMNVYRQSHKPYEGRRVTRVLGGHMLFSGMGLVFRPANQYSGILSANTDDEHVERKCTPVVDEQGNVVMECVLASLAKAQAAAGIPDLQVSHASEGLLELEGSEKTQSTKNTDFTLESEGKTVDHGIRLLEGFPPEGASEIQSVLFDREKWTLPRAKKWLKDHEYKYSKVDVTERFYRFRQHDPKKYKRIRTKRV